MKDHKMMKHFKMINITVICSRILPAVFCISSANSEFIFFITHLNICNMKQRKKLRLSLISITIVVLSWFISLHGTHYILLYLYKLYSIYILYTRCFKKKYNVDHLSITWCWSANGRKMLDRYDVLYVTMHWRIWLALIYIMYVHKNSDHNQTYLGGKGGGGDMKFQKRRDFASRSGAEILPYMGKWKIHGVYNFLYKKFSEHTWTKPWLQRDKQMIRHYYILW